LFGFVCLFVLLEGRFAEESMTHGIFLLAQTFTWWNEHIWIADAGCDIEEREMA
jgi:hypothetical protein